MIFGLTGFFAPKYFVRCKKTFKILGAEDSIYIRKSRMLTSVPNALWVRGPLSGAKMVAIRDDVCDFECFL